MTRPLTAASAAERAAARLAFLRQACERVGWQPAERAEFEMRVELTGDRWHAQHRRRGAVELEALIDAGRLCVWEAYRPDGTRLLRWEVLA